MDEVKPDVVVDLDKKPEEKKEEVDFKVLTEQLEKLNKTVNYLSANHRHDDKLAKRVEEIYEELRASKQPTELPPDADEIDKLAQSDWKGAVEKLADKRFEERIKLERERENEIKTRNYLSGILEKSKQEVMSRHPEIEDDPTSEKAQIFNQIIQEHPDYLNNPYGPKLAMSDMENRLREKGWIDPDINKRIEKEADRRTRISKTTVSKEKSTESGKITLDSGDQEFCKVNGISYEDFAKHKKTLFKGGEQEGVAVNG